jgi:hypothetical protein
MAELLLSSMDSVVRSCQAVENKASMARLGGALTGQSKAEHADDVGLFV